MDILNYIEYYYIDENPSWVKDSKGHKPKPMYKILIDLFLKIVIISLVAAMFYWGTRCVRFVWRHRRSITRNKEWRLPEFDNSGEAGNNVDSVKVDHPHND